MRSWVLVLGAILLCGAAPTRPAASGREALGLQPVDGVPQVGAEFAVDAPVHMPGAASDYVLAVDDLGTALVVWCVANTAYAARVSAAGVLLDSYGVVLPWAAGAAQDPRIAANANGWLVALRNSETGEVLARRIADDGNVLDSTDIVIATTAEPTTVNLARNQDGFWVSYIAPDTGTGTRLLATRIAADGTLVDPDGILVAEGVGAPITMSAGRASALVAWRDSAVVRAARVSSDGALLDSPGVALGDVSGGETLKLGAASDGSNWLVGWDEVTNRSQGLVTVSVRGLGSDGGVLGTAPRALPGGPSVLFQGIASSGSQWAVLDGAGGESLATLVSSDATTLTPFWSGSGPCGGIAWNGEHWVIPCGTAVFAIQVTDVGGLEPLEHVNAEIAPAAAYNGSNFLVTWADNRNGDPAAPTNDIYAARLSGSGARLDTNAVAITHGEAPHVSSDGEDWLVVATSGRNAVGRRVSALGQVLDASDIVLGENDSWPLDVEFDGANWLVTYASATSAGHAALFVARVTPAGELLDPQGILVESDSGGAAAAAFDGSNWNVAGVGPEGLFLARLDQAGTVIGKNHVGLPDGHLPWQVLLLGYRGEGGLFVVWDDTSSDTGVNLRAAHVTPGGSLVEPGGVALVDLTTEPVRLVALSRYGADWLVAWNQVGQAGGEELDAALVASVGAATVTPFVLSQTERLAAAPVLARGSGNVLAAYTETDDLSTRVAARILDYPCDGGADPACTWSAASGGFAGIGSVGAAGALGDGGGAGTEVGGTGGEGGTPTKSGGDESGGSAPGVAGAPLSNGGEPDVGNCTGGSHAGGDGGGRTSGKGGAGAGSSATAGRDGVAGHAATSRAGAPAGDSGCTCRAVRRTPGDSRAAFSLLVVAVFALRRRDRMRAGATSRGA